MGEALEITALHAKSLFKLLDRDCFGSVDIDEFCSGCLRLKGEAKSFDIHCLLYESQRLLEKNAIIIEHLEITSSNLTDYMSENARSLRQSMRQSFIDCSRPLSAELADER